MTPVSAHGHQLPQHGGEDSKIHDRRGQKCRHRPPVSKQGLRYPPCWVSNRPAPGPFLFSRGCLEKAVYLTVLHGPADPQHLEVRDKQQVWGPSQAAESSPWGGAHQPGFEDAGPAARACSLPCTSCSQCVGGGGRRVVLPACRPLHTGMND